MEREDHEWELSKENVQPLRQGRRMTSLTTALHQDQVEEHNTIRLQQNDFETELRTYSGDDPFDVWERYIKWTEQYYPKGGHDGQLMCMLQRCLKEFQDQERYKNDARFIQIWIKFACTTEDPETVFSYMYDNAIGEKVAIFYLEFALSLERKGNINKADAIYADGINRCAEPKHLLKQRYQQFQNRVARNISLQIAESQNPGMDMGEHNDFRSPLCGLKGKGTTQKVGTVRTGLAKTGLAGGLKTTRGVESKQVASLGIPVYQDAENVAPTLVPPQNHEWQSVPVRAVDNRENDLKPGVWTGAKLKQKPGAAAAAAPLVAFPIHQDADLATDETPRKATLMNTQPLSSRKTTETDVLSNLRVQQTSKPLLEIPMYQKDKIYQGLSEFSFEELRAAKYFKKKKEREDEEARLRKEEEQRLKSEMMHKELAEVKGMVAFLQQQILGLNIARPAGQPGNLMQLESLPGNVLAQLLQVKGCLPTVGQPGNSEFYYDGTDTSLSSEVTSAPALASSAASCDGHSSHNSNNSSLVKSGTKVSGSSTENLCPATPMETAAPPSVSAVSHSKSIVTPSSKAMYLEGHAGGNFVRGPLTAPSPTINTKEAMQCVMGLFSTSFNRGDQSWTEELELLNRKAQATSSIPPSGLGFQIHEDTTGTIKLDTPGSKHEEAVLKPSRGLAAGLQPELGYLPSISELSASNVNRGLPRSGVHMADKENELVVPTAKKGARRGLGFAVYEDVEMNYVDKEFTIECQARNDMTIAGLESFDVLAKAASTPCISLADKGQAHKMHQSKEDMSGSLASSTSTSHTFDIVNTPSKHLSPILEGSGDGSGEESNYSKKASVPAVRKQIPPAQGIPNFNKASAHQAQTSEPMETDQQVHRDQTRPSEQADLDRSMFHQIDTTAYTMDDNDQRTQAMLSTSLYVDTRDPFDEKLLAHFLKKLKPPLDQYPNFSCSWTSMPDIHESFFVKLANSYLEVGTCIGEGGYAKLYMVSDTSLDGIDTTTNDTCNAIQYVIKVQTPPCYWEFYVSCELRRRLAGLGASMNVVSSITEIEEGVFFQNGSVLKMKYVERGSLLNLVNKYKNDRGLQTGVEPFACLLTIELLHMFEQIHKCGFIHADVKPDNFVLLDLPILKAESRNPREIFGTKLQLVQLIDFGQSIDLTMFPAGTSFLTKVKTSGFQCIEMKTDRPWTFQTDLFGIAGTLHVVLFGSYMNVFQERGVWRITGNYVRKWNIPLWKQLFHELLNIPSCEHMPDLASLRLEFERYFVDNLVPAYNFWVSNIIRVL